MTAAAGQGHPPIRAQHVEIATTDDGNDVSSRSTGDYLLDDYRVRPGLGRHHGMCAGTIYRAWRQSWSRNGMNSSQVLSQSRLTPPYLAPHFSVNSSNTARAAAVLTAV